MTCIVGLVDEGRVYIGGDSAAVSTPPQYDLVVRRDKKVLRNGQYVFGFTSSFRMGQLLRHRFAPPIYDEAVQLSWFMATKFVDAVRVCLTDGGYARREGDRESAGTFMVGVNDRLFVIHDDYQVAEALDKFDAVGCGDQVARGSLYSTQGLSPEYRVGLALKAAERFSAGVRAPFHIIHT